MLFPSFFNAGKPTYEIEQSLLSSADNQNLKRTPVTSGNKQTWTWSGWIKRGELGTEQHFFESWEGVGDVMFYARFHSNDTIRVKQFQGGDIFELQTNAVFRDPSAWYHVVLSFDTTQATSSDRAKIYVNGELQSLGTANYPSQNLETFVNQSGYIHHLFADLYTSSRSFNGYMAEVHLVDGTALAPTDFGETNDDGVWIPKAFTGSHGTEGWYMKFDPTATNGIGHDYSGNGNNLTSSNFTTSGTGTDVMSDTPTTNWATLNVLGKAISDTGSGTTSDGNLQITWSSYNWYGHKSTIAVSSGKWYYEVTNTTGTIYVYAGFSHVTANSENASNVYRYRSNGTKKGTSATSYGAAWSTAGDICGVAFDADAGTIEFYKNGVSQGTAFSSIPAGEYAAEVMVEGSTTAVVNFGQRAFEYTPPTGFKALNTSNLPAPTVKDGSKNFNTVTYSGDSNTATTISGVGFQPDFVWIKNRTLSGDDYSDHMLFDAIRGVRNYLSTNRTNQETNNPVALQEFTVDGFRPGSMTRTNQTGSGFVAWNWLSGGSGSSNTDGSITSTVSANPTAGFSIVSYTGTGTAGTVGHGLGVAPALMIVKCRNKGFGWTIYHQSLGNTRHLEFTTSTGYTGDAWNSTNPTSTVFSVGTDAGSNNGSTPPNNYIAYCFAEVEGYSKIGSYTGNSSTDGPFVYCGFKPKFIIAKASTNSLTQWIMYDTARNTYNVADDYLQPSNTAAEQTGNNVEFDILSNGFKLRGSDQQVNTSHTYIFYAVAENPFGGSGVSPATAR